MIDPARQAALDTLRAVRQRDAYANLVLPKLLAQRGIRGRDAGFATELTYGTCRLHGLLDAVLGEVIERKLSNVETALMDALRLGSYQLLYTRVGAHAAVSSTVDLVRAEAGSGAAGFVNAVLRQVAEFTADEWVARLAPPVDDDPIGHLAFVMAHPRWIAQAIAGALGDTGEQLAAALRANNERPIVHLAARPGAITADELAAISGGQVAPYSPYGVRVSEGNPGDLEVIREHRAQVQDEGSQLCALALSTVDIDGPDARWLDLCAGPGGKAALLGALVGAHGGTGNGGTLDAVEQAEHRAKLVEQACAGLPVTVHVADGREPGLRPGYDRVLVDAPCTGLGALRRRPEARWRRQPSDVAGLTKLQRELLTSALRLVRPGGVVAYVVCTPHLSETVAVLGSLTRRGVAGIEFEQLDARPYFAGVPDLGEAKHVQLWPHRHGTDAMFCALFRRTK
ncbi:MAG: rRNA small subunit methyltransferase B [Sciscionella sp.]|nr:rRNA small subunit methyltransferase B [Sciscionella sp.]